MGNAYQNATATVDVAAQGVQTANNGKTALAGVRMAGIQLKEGGDSDAQSETAAGSSRCAMRRGIGLLLCLVMLFSSVPFGRLPRRSMRRRIPLRLP